MASRKNFPERVEARRLRALKRNNPIPAATPINTQPAPSPAAADGAPIPPILAEFGLSDHALKRLPKRWFRTSMQTGAKQAWTYLFLHTTTFVLLYHDMIRVSLPTVIGYLGFFFVFIIPFLFFWLTMEWAEKQLYALFNDNFARYLRYEKAVAVF